jgi:hypothetical protein
LVRKVNETEEEAVLPEPVRLNKYEPLPPINQRSFSENFNLRDLPEPTIAEADADSLPPAEEKVSANQTDSESERPIELPEESEEILEEPVLKEPQTLNEKLKWAELFLS